MGKYIRKSSTGGGAAPAVVVAGVRTRSRSATLSSAPAPKKRPRKAAPTRADVEVDKGRDGDGGGATTEGCCYLQLRSRRLFMVAAEVKSSVPVAEAEEQEESSPAVPLAITASVEVSRCSSTASSVDEAALIRSRNDCAAEAREDCGEESSPVCDDPGREGEATPSTLAPGDHSDQESGKAADDDPQHHHRQPSATAPCRAIRMPPPEEIEDFFAAAEKAEAERFAAKYNFDVVRGVPLDAGGRFEWIPVESS